MGNILKQIVYAFGLFLLFLAAEMAVARHIDVTWSDRGEAAEHSQHRYVITTPMAYASLTVGTVLCLYCHLIPRSMRRIKVKKELEKSQAGRYDGYGDRSSYDWSNGRDSYGSSGYDDFTAGLQKSKADKSEKKDDDDELSEKELAKIKKLLKSM